MNVAVAIPGTNEELRVWESQVCLSSQEIGKVLNWSVFRAWIAAMAAKFAFEGIEIQSADFKLTDGSILFLKFKAHVRDRETGKTVPGIVLMRGNVVTALIIGEDEHGVEHVIGVRQARVPVAWTDIPELMAGMMDGAADPLEKVCAETWEELEILLTPADFVDLTKLNPSVHGIDVVYAACGILDVASHVFAARVRLTPTLREQLARHEGGVAEENERIRAIVVPLDDAHLHFPTEGALAALCLYDRLGRKRSGEYPWAFR